MGASLAWGGAARASRTKWTERARPLSRRRRVGRSRPEQRDPVDPAAVCRSGDRHVLTVEVAEDEAFRRVVAHAPAPVSAASDWTTPRAGRRPQAARTSIGTASPTPTGTAAASAAPSPRRTPDDPRPVNFAFVSCQDVNEGKLNAYRRMIFEDERAAPADQLGFVLHLGDFIYEVVEYPEEVKTRYDRTIYEVARIPDGGKVGNFHFPLTRRRLSRRLQRLSRRPRPAGRPRALAVRRDVGQPRILLAGLAKHPAGRRQVAAGTKHQGRRQPGLVGISPVALQEVWRSILGTFRSRPRSPMSQIEKWDENGLGDEPNNLIAINSLIGYRAFRYGKHLDLIITDQHSYHGPDPFSDDSLEQAGRLGSL